MLDTIPCTCNPIYDKRYSCDPDCPRCSCIDENIVMELKDECKL